MVILGTVICGLTLIRRLDCEIKPDRRGQITIAAAAILGNILLRWSCGPGELIPRLLLSVVLGGLLLACITDIAMCQVHNFVWWVSGAAALALLGYRWRTEGASALWELLLFAVVQLLLCKKLYGRADCYAFCVCAAAAAGRGVGLEGFLAHMIFTYAVLIPVQAVGKNIAFGGRLKKPVPFLPYLTAGYYFLLFFHKICGETVVPLS